MEVSNDKSNNSEKPVCTEIRFLCTKTELSKKLGELGINTEHLVPIGTVKNNCFIISETTKPVEPRTLPYRFCAKKENLLSIYFQALRHMFTTNCVALGLDVKSLSEVLSHSKAEITLNS